jgi:hypothetical protein
MPFTLAHPAAVIPVARPLGRLAVPSALVIGSIAPDLAYFLPLGVDRIESHSLAGLFWFCLPIGLATYVLFHLLLKAPLLSLVPASIEDRLESVSPNRLPPVSWLVVVASLLAGALTHVIWDAFTHAGGPAVALIPVLKIKLFAVGRYTVFVYKVLQHASTLVGLTVMAWWSARWLARAPRRPATPRVCLTAAQRVSIGGAMLAVAIVRAVLSARPVLSHGLDVSSVQIALSVAAISGLAALAAALVAYSVLWHLVARGRTPRAPESSGLDGRRRYMARASWDRLRAVLRQRDRAR